MCLILFICLLYVEIPSCTLHFICLSGCIIDYVFVFKNGLFFKCDDVGVFVTQKLLAN